MRTWLFHGVINCLWVTYLFTGCTVCLTRLGWFHAIWGKTLLAWMNSARKAFFTVKLLSKCKQLIKGVYHGIMGLAFLPALTVGVIKVYSPRNFASRISQA